MPTSKPEQPGETEDQYESLLHVVWDSERRERQMDRIDQATRLEEEKAKAKTRKAKKKP